MKEVRMKVLPAKELPDKCVISSTLPLSTKALSNTVKAGLLAHNIFRRPSHSDRIGVVDNKGKKMKRYLQLRDSLRFTHNSLLIPFLHGNLFCLIGSKEL